jgi:hypothetical protein
MCPTCRQPMLTEWPHKHARTIGVGLVHVGKNAIGEPFACADNCPHPDHPEAPNGE